MTKSNFGEAWENCKNLGEFGEAQAKSKNKQRRSEESEKFYVLEGNFVRHGGKIKNGERNIETRRFFLNMDKIEKVEG